MKGIGVTRKLDPVGRIVIPRELRSSLEIKMDDPLEVFVDNESIILKKYLNSCIFCDENDSRILHLYKGKLICNNCTKNINLAEG